MFVHAFQSLDIPSLHRIKPLIKLLPHLWARLVGNIKVFHFDVAVLGHRRRVREQRQLIAQLCQLLEILRAHAIDHLLRLLESRFEVLELLLRIVLAWSECLLWWSGLS